jgi:transcriptional regulator with XRE-family HTH domain
MPKLRAPTKRPLSATTTPLGMRIASFRKKRGFTQTQLAETVGISRNVIADYENDRIRIYDEMIARLAIALKVTTDELLGLKNQSLGEDDQLSLRFVKRVRAIQKLPESEQKAIIKILDLALKSPDSNLNR